MKKLTWWFRIVGAFYLLLAALNMYGMFINPQMIAESIPFPADASAIRSFWDGWSAFAFFILGLATFMLWASRDPLKYLGAVWLIVWLELFYGVGGDVYLIAGGYDAVSYIVFIVIHLVIIVTGVMFAREASAKVAEPLKA